MSIAKHIALALMGLVVYLQLLGILNAQNVDTGESERIAKFLAKVVAEREKLVMFQYECTIVTSPDGLLGERFPKNLKIRYEYSKLDNHEILIADYSNCDASQKRPTFWIGRSGKYVISGKKGARESKSFISIDKWPDDDYLEGQPYIDVKVLGLGFCGDLLRRSVFGSIMTSLKEQSARTPDMRIVDDPEGKRRLKDQFDVDIAFDEQSGLWPLESKLAFATWEITVQKRHDCYVPTEFRVECKDFKDGENSLKARLDWLSINEPFKTGKECAAKISSDYKVPLEFMDE